MRYIHLQPREYWSLSGIQRRADNGCEFSKAWLPYTDMTEAQLKEIWDNWDGFSVDGEYAHHELNRRGLGEYCAA